MAVYESALDLIGDTPIVDISPLSPNPKVRILAKLEGQNPGGSVKDRAAKWMILEAEKDGTLTPGSGQVILESSSGNTGIALAMIAKTRGYHLKVVLPDNVSVERRQLLESWGAEIIDSPGSEGSNGAMRRAQAMAAEHPEWWFPFQYGNPANPKAHYEGTGPEIWRDVPELTHFVAGLGTAGTLMGVGRFLKERNPDVQIWAIEPPVGEMVDGLKNFDEGFVPAGVHRQRRLRPARPPPHRAAAGVDRVDPPPHRGRHLRGHQLRRDPGRRREGGRAHRRGHDRDDRVRRRLEVPLGGRVDRRPRHRRGPRQVHDLLLERR